MSLGPLCTSLLRFILAGKEVIWADDGVIKAGEEVIAMSWRQGTIRAKFN